MRAVELRNREIVASPGIWDLLERAFANPRHPEAEDVRGFLGQLVGRPEIGVFIAFEDGQLLGLAIFELPDDGPLAAFNKMPWASHFWAQTPRASAALAELATRWLWERGYRHFRTMNLTGRPETVYQRWMSRWSLIRPVGMVYECELGKKGVEHEHERRPQPISNPGRDPGGIQASPGALRRLARGILGWRRRRVSRPAGRAAVGDRSEGAG